MKILINLYYIPSQFNSSDPSLQWSILSQTYLVLMHLPSPQRWSPSYGHGIRPIKMKCTHINTAQPRYKVTFENVLRWISNKGFSHSFHISASLQGIVLMIDALSMIECYLESDLFCIMLKIKLWLQIHLYFAKTVFKHKLLLVAPCCLPKFSNKIS